MTNRQIFLNYLLGEASWIAYTVAMLFVFFGLIVKWYIQVRRGVYKNPASPNRFSLNYFVGNNLWRKLFGLFANVVIAFLALRFSQEIFNVPFSMGFAASIGIGFDVVIDAVSRWKSNLDIPEKPR